jgi:hypothetical protein
MKLIRFLTLGRSLKESKDQLGMYRLEPSNSIPKFEPAQRTLALDAAPEAQAPQPASPLERVGAGAGNAWNTMVRNLVGGDKTRRRTSVHRQTELNLDHVTVIRNDLNETDMDLVARNSKASKRAPEAAFDGRQASGWMRLTQRLFRSHKDPFGGAAPGSSGYSAKRTRELIART